MPTATLSPMPLLFTLDRLDLSGAVFSTQHLVSGLLEHSARPMILARGSGEREQNFRDLGVEILIARHFGLPLLGRSVLSTLQAYRPCLIHAQTTEVIRRSFSLARRLRLPLVVSVNRLEDENTPFLADHPEIYIIAVSDAIQERLTNRDGISRERIEVIPNGLDLRYFPCRPFDLPERTGHIPVVAVYGTLTERKGQRIFLLAAAEVIKSGMDAEFLITGHGPDKPELRRLAQELGIERRITFTPSTCSDIGIFSGIDLFVEPSYQEGFGLSVLQAMASGVPVIASGVGGIFSLVKDGETGLLVPSGDPHALAQAICTLLASPQRRREMARRARDRVEMEFQASIIAARMLQFYQNRVLSPKRSGTEPE